MLFDALMTEFPDSSKATLRQWLSTGRVLVRGQVVRDPKAAIAEGERPTLGLRSVRASPGGGAVTIPLLYRDAALLMINKPAGLLSVAAAYERERSAHAILEQQLRTTVYPVHRLDRETSGVLCFALQLEAQQVLKQRFAEHALQRQYVAVVEGRLEDREGEWRSWLKEDGVSYQVSVASPHDPDAHEAVTLYEVMKEGRHRSLLRLTLHTGKKHQIRVHCAQAGVPVVGDGRYGHADRRLALHAEYLGMEHPLSDRWIEGRVPSPPMFHALLHA